MIDLIFKVFETVKNGISSYKKSKKELFQNYLEPAMSDFEKVHENYLHSFNSYINILNNGESPLDENHPIFDMIKSDSLFSSHLRSKLYSFYDYANNDEFINFTKSLYNYFNYSLNAPRLGKDCTEDYFETNLPRQSFLNALKYKELSFWETGKGMAIKEAKVIISDLQLNYLKVMNEYNSLKNELLTK